LEEKENNLPPPAIQPQWKRVLVLQEKVEELGMMELEYTRWLACLPETTLHDFTRPT
jgi:hypothetical protein